MFLIFKNNRKCNKFPTFRINSLSRNFFDPKKFVPYRLNELNELNE